VNWEEKKDDNGNTYYVTDGPKGESCRWEIYPTIKDDKLCFAVAPRDWVPSTFSYLDAAMKAVARKHLAIEEFAKSD